MFEFLSSYLYLLFSFDVLFHVFMYIILAIFSKKYFSLSVIKYWVLFFSVLFDEKYYFQLVDYLYLTLKLVFVTSVCSRSSIIYAYKQNEQSHWQIWYRNTVSVIAQFQEFLKHQLKRQKSKLRGFQILAINLGMNLRLCKIFKSKHTRENPPTDFLWCSYVELWPWTL